VRTCVSITGSKVIASRWPPGCLFRDGSLFVLGDEPRASLDQTGSCAKTMSEAIGSWVVTMVMLELVSACFGCLVVACAALVWLLGNAALVVPIVLFWQPDDGGLGWFCVSWLICTNVTAVAWFAASSRPPDVHCVFWAPRAASIALAMCTVVGLVLLIQQSGSVGASFALWTVAAVMVALTLGLALAGLVWIVIQRDRMLRSRLPA